MYPLDTVSVFQVTEPTNTYIYDIVPTTAGLATISSDDTLRLLDPLSLDGPALTSVPSVHTDVTCLKVLNSGADGNSAIICTAGRDGKACLIDSRSSSKVAEVTMGECSSVTGKYDMAPETMAQGI